MILLAVLGDFLHGLVFFSLGITVVFLHRRSHRVSLMRQLTWLSGFAISEALSAWLAMFAGLVPAIGGVASLVLPVLLAVAYTFLLGFGLQTTMSEASFQTRARSLFVTLCGLWLVPYAIAVASVRPNWAELLIAGSVVRYLLALPGGVLAAIGLWRRGHRSLDAAVRRRVRPYQRITAAAMMLFAVLNVFAAQQGLVLSAIPMSLPVILVVWIRVAAGGAMTYGLVKSLTTIEVEIERWVEGVERLQTLVDDRERIGRELHDGIIQSIYAAGLLLEGIVPVIPVNPERAQSQLGRVMDNLNDTIRDIRRYIFDLRSDMVDEELPDGIEHLLRDFRVNTLLETEFEFSGEVRPINSIMRRRHVFQIVREALTNTAKHARARWVSVQLAYSQDSLELMISDDGIGMEQLLVSKGYGLRNIRERARLLGGALRVESAPGEGVTYHLTVPYM